MKNKKQLISKIAIAAISISSVLPINYNYAESIKESMEKKTNTIIEANISNTDGVVIGVENTNEEQVTEYETITNEEQVTEYETITNEEDNTIKESENIKENQNISKEVQFESDDFRKYIVEMLNKKSNRLPDTSFREDSDYNPTIEDMELLKQIRIPIYFNDETLNTKNITSLKGIEYAVNLETFELENSSIHELSLLYNLSKLERIAVLESKVNNLEGISNLNNLKTLDIQKNEIVDMSPISNMSSLEFISIRGNYVTDAKPFENLTNLTYLHLYENRIEDISMLDKLTKLEEFNVSKNRIKDISILSNYKNLSVFQARQNKIEDISPLVNLFSHSLGKITNEFDDDGMSTNGAANVDENNIKDISKLIDFHNINGGEDSRHLIISNQRATVNISNAEKLLKDNIYYIEIDNPIRRVDGSFGKIIEDTADFKFSYNYELSKLTLEIPKGVFETKGRLYSQFNFPEEINANISKPEIVGSEIIEVLVTGFDFDGDLEFILKEGDNSIENSYLNIDVENDSAKEIYVSLLNKGSNRFNGNPFSHDKKTYTPTKYDMLTLKKFTSSPDYKFEEYEDFQTEKEHFDSIVKDLTNLKGLEYAKYLEELEFTTGNLVDISSIENLKRLKSIDLSNNKNIKNFNSLKDMKLLETLNLSNTNIKDLSIFKSLPKLKEIDVIGANICSRFDLDNSINIIGLIENKENDKEDSGSFLSTNNTITEKETPKEDIIEKETSVFIDIPTNHWAKASIDNLIAQDLLKGYEDNTFRPDNTISRGEFVNLLDRVFEFKDTDIKDTFKDTNNTKWYSKVINKLKSLNIVSGNGDNNFNPERDITREEMVKLLISTIEKDEQLKTKKSDISFIDNKDISPWAIDYISKAIDLELIEGYSDNTIRPKNSITRAEVATILNRLLLKLNK